MAYHTPLTNSQEFTAALLKSRELAHNITMGMRQIPGTSPDFEVFPYTYVLLFPELLHLIFKNCSCFYSSVNGQFLFIIYMPIATKSTRPAVSDQCFSPLLLPG